jgi:hypothetical protein
VTATASDLDALRAAASSGDRFALSLLADLAEDGAPGWEHAAWAVLHAAGVGREDGREVNVWAWGDTAPGSARRDLIVEGPGLLWVWQDGPAPGWSESDETWGRATANWPPPGVRDAVLSACRLALAGLSP